VSTLQARFGQKLRAVRKEKGVSQEELSHLAGLDRTYVSTVERGLKNVSLATIAKLAKGLRVRMAELMPD
jgi:transcriptional regulator with XRE-family HTH domain